MLNYLIVYCSKPMYVLPLNPSILHHTVGVTHIQSLYVKVLNSVNIYQIDEFFSGTIKNTIRRMRKSRILLQEV